MALKHVLTLLSIFICAGLAIVGIGISSWNGTNTSFVGPFGVKECSGSECSSCYFELCKVKMCKFPSGTSGVAETLFEDEWNAFLTGSNCTNLRVVQAFSAISVLCYCLAFLFASIFLCKASRMFNHIATGFTFLGVICGIVAQAVWMNKMGSPEYAYGFGLFFASWVFGLAVSVSMFWSEHYGKGETS